MLGFDYDSAVQYPFGHGLSYTAFSQEIANFTGNGDSVSLAVTVTNTGNVFEESKGSKKFTTTPQMAANYGKYQKIKVMKKFRKSTACGRFPELFWWRLLDSNQ